MPALVTVQSITYAAWTRRATPKQWEGLIRQYLESKGPSEVQDAKVQLIDFLLQTFDTTPTASPVLAGYLDLAVLGLEPTHGSDGNGGALITVPAFVERLLHRYRPGPQLESELGTAYLHNVSSHIVKWFRADRSLLHLPATTTTEATDPDPAVATIWLRWMALVAQLVDQDVKVWTNGISLAAMTTDTDMMVEVNTPGAGDPASAVPIPGTTKAPVPHVTTETQARRLDRLRSGCLLLTQWLQTQWGAFEALANRDDLVTMEGDDGTAVSDAWRHLMTELGRLQTTIQAHQEHLMGDGCVFSLTVALREHLYATQTARQCDHVQALQRSLGYRPLTPLDLPQRSHPPCTLTTLLFGHVVAVAPHVPDATLASHLLAIQTIKGLGAQEFYTLVWLCAITGLAEVSSQELSLAQIHRVQVWRAFLFTKLPSVLHLLVYHRSPDTRSSEFSYQEAVAQRLVSMERAVLQLPFFQELTDRCKTADAGDLVTLLARVCIRRDIVRADFFLLECNAKLPADDALNAALLAHHDAESLIAGLLNDGSPAACRGFIAAACVDTMNQRSYIDALVQLCGLWAAAGQVGPLAALCTLVSENLSLVHMVRLFNSVPTVVRALKWALNRFIGGPTAGGANEPFSGYAEFESILVLLLQIRRQAPEAAGTNGNHGDQHPPTPFLDDWLVQYAAGQFGTTATSSTLVEADDPTASMFVVDAATVNDWYATVFPPRTAGSTPTLLPEDRFRTLTPQAWLRLLPALVTRALHGCLAQTLDQDQLLQFLQAVLVSPARFALLAVVRVLCYFIAYLEPERVHVPAAVLHALLELDNGFPTPMLTVLGPDVLGVLASSPTQGITLWAVQAKLLPFAQAGNYLTPMIAADQLLPRLHTVLITAATGGKVPVTHQNSPLALPRPPLASSATATETAAAAVSSSSSSSSLLSSSSATGTGAGRGPVDVNLLAHLARTYDAETLVGLLMAPVLRATPADPPMLQLAELIAGILTTLWTTGVGASRPAVPTPLYQVFLQDLLPQWLSQGRLGTYHQEVTVGYVLLYSGVLMVTGEQSAAGAAPAERARNHPNRCTGEEEGENGDVNMVPAPPTTQTPMSEEDLVDLGVHRLDARRPGQAQLQKFLHWYVGWLRTLHTAGPEEQRESLAARLHDGEVHNGTTGVMDHQLPGSGILDVLLHRNPMCQWVADTCLAV